MSGCAADCVLRNGLQRRGLRLTHRNQVSRALPGRVADGTALALTEAA
jgi:hypothetical protein